MAINKAKKTEIFARLKDAVKNSAGLVFVNFHGLSSNEANEIRRTLDKEKVSYFVAKKTLTRKALEEAGVEGERPEFEGELGIVYGSDALSSAKGVYSFQKKLDNKISILGGVFEGRFAGKDEMVALAQVPSMETLRAQFVNIINSPIQGLVISLSEIAKKKS